MEKNQWSVENLDRQACLIKLFLSREFHEATRNVAQIQEREGSLVT
jgi:ribosome-associated toxin RatA of RatAB toxin-antitoxin module